MKIAIHAADLDCNRVDGTRVYLLNMLKNFGMLAKEDSFFIYHKNEFNPLLTPPFFFNYEIKKESAPFFWTQTRFALDVWKDKPDVLWMPVHNIPILKRRGLKSVVTIHDLAFKKFPQYFPENDLKKLNRLVGMAVKRADHLIAISECTKKDLLEFFPEISEERISVVHHGFDTELFRGGVSVEESENILASYKLKAKSYLLYVGAIQPRKDLGVLISAFAEIKKKRPEMKLVFAGALAWSYESILQKIEESGLANDIIITGTVPFKHLPALYANASVFIFPSLYEGFGIPVLEAMASGVPVVCADASSLPEVGGDAALYFEPGNSNGLQTCIERILDDEALRQQLVAKGKVQAKKFSWEKCAEETLAVIKNLK